MRVRSGWQRSSVAVCAALVLVACPAQTPRNAPASPAVVPDGSVTVAVPEEPPTLNPLVQAGLSPATRQLLPLVTPVVRHGRSGPGVVRGTFTPSEAGVRIVVAPGSTWSDGTAITGEDIVRTWRLVRRSRLPFSGYEGWADARVNGEAVEVTLATGASAPDDVRVLPPGFSPRVNAKRWPISGGPFMLRSWTPGLRMAFAANPASPGAQPLLARIEVVFVTDPEAALALFKRRQIDVLTRFGAPAWHDRLMRAGAQLGEPGEGQPVALVLRAPRGSQQRSRMLARIDLVRLTDVLVQDEAVLRCSVTPAEGVCARNPSLPAPGPEVDGLRLAFPASDVLGGRVAVALRRMLGSVRLQPREDIWTGMGSIDIALVTATGADGLPALEAAGTRSPRIYVLFVARSQLGARVALGPPGPGGPFDGAALWPPAAGER